MRTQFDFESAFDTHDLYSSFFTLFFKGAMLSPQWKSINIDNYEDKLTVSNEAFALCCLDNAFERWRAECVAKFSKRPEYAELLLGKDNILTKEEINDLPRWRYTCDTTNSNIRSGWNEEGKILYFRLYEICAAQREKHDKNARYAFALSNSPEIRKNIRKRRSLESDEVNQRRAEVAEAMRRNHCIAFPT